MSGELIVGMWVRRLQDGKPAQVVKLDDSTGTMTVDYGDMPEYYRVPQDAFRPDDYNGDGPTPDQMREALQLLREGLDVPHAATVGDEQKRADIMYMRTIFLVIMLRNLAEKGRGRGSYAHDLSYARERLAEHPAVGYRKARSQPGLAS